MSVILRQQTMILYIHFIQENHTQILNIPFGSIAIYNAMLPT